MNYAGNGFLAETGMYTFGSLGRYYPDFVQVFASYQVEDNGQLEWMSKSQLYITGYISDDNSYLAMRGRYSFQIYNWSTDSMTWIGVEPSSNIPRAGEMLWWKHKESVYLTKSNIPAYRGVYVAE